MKEGQVVEVWAEAGKRGLSAPQLALLLGLSPPGPAHSTVVGSSNKRHQEAPWVLLTLPTFTGCFHPVLMVLAVGRREGEQLSPITVAPVRLAQFLSQTYPGLYVRDMIFRLGEESDGADGSYVCSKHTSSRLCAGAGIGMQGPDTTPGFEKLESIWGARQKHYSGMTIM